MAPTFVEQLAKACDASWPAITTARDDATKRIDSVRKEVAKLEDPQVSLTVTGSIARHEVTGGSDFDWMLLVDGASDPEHFKLREAVAEELDKLDIKRPGPTEIFGKLVSSHDLVHYIAGTADTNENLTRRILLLLESTAVSNAPVRERVLRNVLARYVIHDRSIPGRSGGFNCIPHFLLNDVVRYWRTMAADFCVQNVGAKTKRMGDQEHQASIFAKAPFCCWLAYVLYRLPPASGDLGQCKK
jgi:predicted nucleotidyltransferase